MVACVFVGEAHTIQEKVFYDLNFQVFSIGTFLILKIAFSKMQIVKTDCAIFGVIKEYLF